MGHRCDWLPWIAAAALHGVWRARAWPALISHALLGGWTRTIEAGLNYAAIAPEGSHLCRRHPYGIKTFARFITVQSTAMPHLQTGAPPYHGHIRMLQSVYAAPAVRAPSKRPEAPLFARYPAHTAHTAPTQQHTWNSAGTARGGGLWSIRSGRSGARGGADGRAATTSPAAAAAPRPLLHRPGARPTGASSAAPAVKPPSAFPSEIVPGFLFLGSYDHASRQEILKTLGIANILNVSARRSCCYCCLLAHVHCSTGSDLTRLVDKLPVWRLRA